MRSLMKRRWMGWLLGLCFVFCIGSANAQNGWKEIDAKTLKKRLDGGEKILVVDVRPSIFYDLNHIPGAVNIPLGELEQSDLLPADKSIPLVFYCMGRA